MYQVCSQLQGLNEKTTILLLSLITESANSINQVEAEDLINIMLTCKYQSSNKGKAIVWILTMQPPYICTRYLLGGINWKSKTTTESQYRYKKFDVATKLRFISRGWAYSKFNWLYLSEIDKIAAKCRLRLLLISLHKPITTYQSPHRTNHHR